MSDGRSPVVSAGQSDSPRWYFREDEAVFGPFTLNEMAEFVRTGKIGPHDEIWVGSSPRWILAERVSLLFRLAGCTPETAPKQPRGASKPNILNGLVSALYQRAGSGFTYFSESARQSWQKATALITSIGLVPVVILVAVVSSTAFACLGPPIPWIQNLTYPLNARSFDVFQAAWNEVTELRDAQAAPEDWDRLAVRVNAEAAPLLVELKKTAGASDRAAQQLLWAGRDCLLPLVAKRDKWDHELSHAFEEHMENAHKVIGGESFDFGAIAWRIRRNNTQPPGPLPWRPGLMELIIAADAVILLWLLQMGLKRVGAFS